MFCFNSHGHNAYLKIMPYKVETVSLDPRVDLYYNVLSDYEIDVIKELATPRVRIINCSNLLKNDGVSFNEPFSQNDKF